ncbi:protein FAM166B [Exaiptasia diaphana]|uniref:Ciliary microtubule inner protein 2A-C-like domain-containing protein n=1 Tax=Exaiptasia diaphana TaxID=2652724 RepID=A0A913XSH0_EXADI|nr:protein FAM166B [Exaiptasia diaphana]KXJ09194.1 Protein FAM166B [Exaiptasia diaphana]
MDKKKKSTLMTPDPYHIPGYCGYCPQFKYQIGETFGQTTSTLLTSPIETVASSGKPVLAEIEAEKPRKFDDRRDVIATRTFSLGDQKLTDKMVPGYTGYIPKSEHYFGNSYAETSRSAIASFQKDQVGHHKKTTDLRTIADLQQGKQVLPGLMSESTRVASKYKVPLKPIGVPQQYYSKKAMQHSLSPFALSNGDPKKFLMSGYTGFVPLYRGCMGLGFPALTNKALCEFTDETTRLKSIENQPVVVRRPKVKPVKISTIYEMKPGTGLVPHYTGHVPGEKFRYGMTFGYSTQHAQHALKT